MRKLFLLSISIIMLFLFIFITREGENSILEISYDHKAYKIQPNTPINSNKTTNFAIYDTLNNTKSIIADKVIANSEIPLSINKENSIDTIIDTLVEEQYSQKYKKIKISSVRNADNHKLTKSLNKNIKDKYYVLNLGLFPNKQRALEQIQNLMQIYPDYPNLYQIEPYNFKQYILYKLTLQVTDFNTALKICQIFLKYQESCIILNLKE